MKVLAPQSSRARQWRWDSLKPRNHLRPVGPRNNLGSLLNSVRKLSLEDLRARVPQRLTRVSAASA